MADSPLIDTAAAITPVTTPAVTAPAKDATKDAPSVWRGRIDRCKTRRRQLLTGWTTNIDYRRGKATSTEDDEQRLSVPTDWSQTKAKQAQLFSQVPRVVLEVENEGYKPAVPVFEHQLNTRLKKARVGVALDEVLPDCINAAGVGAVIVAFDARTKQVQIPEAPPMMQPPVPLGQVAPPQPPPVMRTINRVMDSRFTVTRVSPSDLLWPDDFTGSDFDDASWLGRSGRTTWADALNMFAKSPERPNGLEDADKDKVLGDDRTALDRLSNEVDNDAIARDEDVVGFDELFYWRYRYHSDEMNYSAIQRLVFIHGKDTPVINEPWKGQRMDPMSGRYLGACKLPIRVLTLTYISEESIPPSDTAVGRPQVDELIEYRRVMKLQRQHSLPLNWMDVNRIDPTIQTTLMEGTWQGFIPTNGDGTRVIGQVARSSYPVENEHFERINKQDSQEAWQVGPNQTGAMSSGEKSASEANIAQQNFQTRIGYERARCVSFFVSIAEVLAGLMCLYDTFDLPNISDQDKQRLQSWDRTRINQEFVFSVLADSTVLLDSNQRLNKIERFLSHTATSGMTNPLPVLEEYASLSGLDPAKVVQQPHPKAPDQPNISFRFSGAADLMNPLALGMMIKAGLTPSPDDMAAAHKMLEDVLNNSTTSPVVVVPKGGSVEPVAPVAPHGVNTPPPQPMPQGGPQMPPAGATSDAPPPDQPPTVPPMTNDRPDFKMIDRIDKRRPN